MTSEPQDKDFLKTLAKGFGVIKSFGHETSTMTLAETAKRNKISRASARRFLLTLQRLGYVAEVDGRYRLTARILELGYPYLAMRGDIEVINAYLKEVAVELKATCSASVLDGPEVMFIARVPYQQLISINLQVGARLEALYSSMGRILLADLPDSDIEAVFRHVAEKRAEPLAPSERKRIFDAIKQAKADQYAFVDQELAVGLRALAVPVRDQAKQLICAINVATSTDPSEPVDAFLARALPVLKAAAERIQLAL